MPEKKESVALLFSGGTDSTYAACRLSDTFSTIHLFTYERQGFFGSRIVLCRVAKLRARFPHARFIHHFIDYDAFYRDLAYKHYLYNLSRHGLLVLATCGFCKVAMHWRNLIYCTTITSRTRRTARPSNQRNTWNRIRGC